MCVSNHLAYLGALQLVEDGVEVAALVAPELDLHVRRRVHALV